MGRSFQELPSAARASRCDEHRIDHDRNSSCETLEPSRDAAHVGERTQGANLHGPHILMRVERAHLRKEERGGRGITRQQSGRRLHGHHGHRPTPPHRGCTKRTKIGVEAGTARRIEASDGKCTRSEAHHACRFL